MSVQSPEDCEHLDNWFDRTLCQCGGEEWPGVMHTICSNCGTFMGPDGIRHQRYLDSIPETLLMDTPQDRDRLIRALAAVRSDKSNIAPNGTWDLSIDEEAADIMGRLRP